MIGEQETREKRGGLKGFAEGDIVEDYSLRAAVLQDVERVRGGDGGTGRDRLPRGLRPDMADCTFHETDICSLCCTLEKACEDSCKKPMQLGRKPGAETV